MPLPHNNSYHFVKQSLISGEHISSICGLEFNARSGVNGPFPVAPAEDARSHTVTNLQPGVEYTFVVLVTAKDGQQLVYTPLDATTASVSPSGGGPSSSSTSGGADNNQSAANSSALAIIAVVVAGLLLVALVIAVVVGGIMYIKMRQMRARPNYNVRAIASAPITMPSSLMDAPVRPNAIMREAKRRLFFLSLFLSLLLPSPFYFAISLDLSQLIGVADGGGGDDYEMDMDGGGDYAQMEMDGDVALTYDVASNQGSLLSQF